MHAIFIVIFVSFCNPCNYYLLNLYETGNCVYIMMFYLLSIINNVYKNFLFRLSWNIKENGNRETLSNEQQIYLRVKNGPRRPLRPQHSQTMTHSMTSFSWTLYSVYILNWFILVNSTIFTIILMICVCWIITNEFSKYTV